MTSSKPILMLAFLITSTLMAQKAVTPPMAQEPITELMSKDLARFPGKEVLMYTVLLRIGIGVGFLSVVADRFGLWERLGNRMSTGGISHGSWNTAQAQLVFAGWNDPAGGHRPWR
jgi:hypothetical protein